MATASLVLFNIPYSILYFRPIPFFDQCVPSYYYMYVCVHGHHKHTHRDIYTYISSSTDPPQNRYLIQPKRARDPVERSTRSWLEAVGYQVAALFITWLVSFLGSTITVRFCRCVSGWGLRKRPCGNWGAVPVVFRLVWWYGRVGLS